MTSIQDQNRSKSRDEVLAAIRSSFYTEVMQTYGKPPKVGGDIKYFCPKCNLDLAHTIMAIVNNEPVRVKCNTCKSERNFRQKKTATEILRPSSPRPKIRDTDLYQRKLQESIMATPKTYRADEVFGINDVVMHPTFGKGVVVRLSFPDRMEVLFKDQSRTLVCKIAQPDEAEEI